MRQNSPQEPNDKLTQQTRTWHNDATTPPRVTAAVRTAILTPREAWRGRGVPQWQMAAAATILLGATLFTAPLLLAKPTLAAVAQAMAQVRRVQWRTETQTHDTRTGALLKVTKGRTIIDLERNSGRVETEPDEVYIRTPEGVFWRKGNERKKDERPVTLEELRADLRRRIFVADKVRGRGAEWQTGEVVVNGRRLLHFTPIQEEGSPASVPGPAREEFWADPITLLIVQTRYTVPRIEKGPGQRVLADTFITNNYEYDRPIPESTFLPDR